MVCTIVGVCVVVQCKIAGYVGIHGIMVRETKETFGIVTQDNKFKGNSSFTHLFCTNCLSKMSQNSVCLRLHVKNSKCSIVS